MRALLISASILALSVGAMAQKIQTSKKENTIKGKAAIGYWVELEGKKEPVANDLGKYLKDFGRAKNLFDNLTLNNPSLGGTVYEGKTLYASAEGDEKKVNVWVGIDTSEWRGTDLNNVWPNIEKIVYQYAVRHYKGKSQNEMGQTQAALEAVERQKNRLQNQSKDLALKLSNNEQEKLHLEKSLEANAFEHAVLLQKIANNKKSQDSVAAAGLQIQKVLDGQKEKSKKIN